MRTLPIISSGEFITIGSRGCEKRMVDYLSIRAEQELNLFQVGEPDSTYQNGESPAERAQLCWYWIDPKLAVNTKLEIEKRLAQPFECKDKIIQLPDRNVELRQIRWYQIRWTPYNEQGVFRVIFHGSDVAFDDEQPKRHFELNAPNREVSKAMADFLVQIHECSYSEALKCASSQDNV